MSLEILSKGIPIDPLPKYVGIIRDPSVPHAPPMRATLTKDLKILALRNSLRYFPSNIHDVLAKEFKEELDAFGHIYMYRFRPTEFEMKAYPLSTYPAKCTAAASMMLMIMNNLDARVAQYPHELVTLTEEQVLVMYSGHPMGLFPSTPDSPRAVITNGMVIPNYSSREEYDKMYATGVSMYGQMTAGSYCYIGPQGIVHGTTITVLNACRKYLGKSDTSGIVYLSSGLGGMSGAQPKAAVIAGCIGVIVEVDEAPLLKRHKQGWVQEIISDLDELITRIRSAKKEGEALSIGVHGNYVDVLEKLAEHEYKHHEGLVELASDQTSCHNPYNGGYYPVQLTFEESQNMMVDNPNKFKTLVQESLIRQINAINSLSEHSGMKFWDYGNSFLLEVSRAGGDVHVGEGEKGHGIGDFKYPSYVQDIMGDIFSLGFGPFRWVCTSCDPEDLRKSDAIAYQVLKSLNTKETPAVIQEQLNDNIQWIENAEKHKLVVGSQARILYADAVARVRISQSFNEAILKGDISAPIVLSRDHHDVSGTDSPFRETSNVTDGSGFTADMAVQNVIGDALRGASWVAIHNGGGVGWGEVMNGGFGMVLDGTAEAGAKAERVLFWDVNNGVSRRAWARNSNAELAIQRAMKAEPRLTVTMPHHVDTSLLDNLIE